MLLKLVETVTAENPIAGDLELSGGDLVWTTDLHIQVVQRLRSRLEFFKGEWYLDAEEGTPYHQVILANKGVTDQALSAIFSTIIRECPGVSTLDEISVTRNHATRQADVAFKARLEDGYLLDSRTVPPFRVRF